MHQIPQKDPKIPLMYLNIPQMVMKSLPKGPKTLTKIPKSLPKNKIPQNGPTSPSKGISFERFSFPFCSLKQ